MSKNSSINLDKRAKRNREISIRVNDYELLELKKRNFPRPNSRYIIEAS